MAHPLRMAVIALLAVAGTGCGTFWAGMVWQDVLYTDQCLDMGGGRSPGGHAICVLPGPPQPAAEAGIRSSSYQCDDGQGFTMLFVGEGRAIVDRGASQPPVEMTQVPAASGARYAAGEDTLWVRGGEALRIRGDGSPLTCLQRRGSATVKLPASRG